MNVTSAADEEYAEEVREERKERAQQDRQDAAMELVGYVGSLRDMGLLEALPHRHMNAINGYLRRAGADDDKERLK